MIPKPTRRSRGARSWDIREDVTLHVHRYRPIPGGPAVTDRWLSLFGLPHGRAVMADVSRTDVADILAGLAEQQAKEAA